MAAANEHILVVEDEEHLAAGIKYNLEAEGYRVTSVPDGPTALKLIQENAAPVDLVVLDLMLPGMSGYAVCETIRESGMDIPILILSARTLVEDRTRGFDVGANQYLTKPFELDELLSRINGLLVLSQRAKALHHASSAALNRYFFRDVDIDFESYVVKIGEKTIRLTQLEMKLLQYFCENANRVLSRNELLKHVWNMPGHLQTRAPDQFIRRLRKLFEADPAQPVHFLTIRDAGYRFVPNPPADGTFDSESPVES